MKNFIDWLHEVDIIGLCLEIGLGVFVLVSLVRCAFE